MRIERQVRGHLLLLTLAAPLLVSAASTAEPAAATPWLKAVIDRAHVLAEKRVKPQSDAERKWTADVKTVIDDLLDWDEMTRRALGRHWETQSPKDRDEFSALLRQMVEASYQGKLRLLSRGELKKPTKVTIEWLDEKRVGKECTVTGRVKGDKTVATVQFSLGWSGSRWKVHDISIDEVSTVRTYRTQFGKVIGKDGFAALLAKMRSKTDEIREGRADLAP